MDMDHLVIYRKGQIYDNSAGRSRIVGIAEIFLMRAREWYGWPLSLTLLLGNILVGFGLLTEPYSYIL